MKIIFSEEADSDLLQIHSYLAARNRAAAVSLAKIFKAKFENLAHFPFIGRDRSSLSHGVRSVVAENYVIFYHVERDRIMIVRVLDGRRDIDVEFQR
jgi:toxin ParE1/3/4